MAAFSFRMSIGVSARRMIEDEIERPLDVPYGLDDPDAEVDGTAELSLG